MAERTFTIRGAETIDGTGSKPSRKDVLVKEGVIAKFGSILRGEEEGRVIDGSGLTLTPGFIDMHAHSDLAVISDPEHLSKVTQGVTFEVVGQDGLSYVPSSEETLHALRKQLFGWNGEPKNLTWNFNSVAEYLREVDKGAAVNVAYLIPHGSVRMMVRGNDAGFATQAEIASMEELVDTGMKQGAVGLSAGLTYTPGMYADDSELTSLCAIVAKHGGYYGPHHRNYGVNFLEAIDDCVKIARDSKVGLHLTHCTMNAPIYHGRSDLLFERLDEAEKQGVDVTLDSYPYLAASTYLHAMLPSWCQEGGSEAIHQRFGDRDIRAKIAHELTVSGSDGNHGAPMNFQTVKIAGAQRPENSKYIGLALDEAAKIANQIPVEFYLDFIASENFMASCVLFNGHEGNVRSIMQHPRHMAGSDGILMGNRPHPRAYGTFARYLGFYARQEKVLTMHEAVAHMTGRPAIRLGLSDRGLLKEGFHADLVLFDAQTVIDRSTYDNPRLPAAGFEAVWVNGLQTLAGGRRTSNLPGRAHRHKSKK
jgi:N-acyl-D-amino-acid deacylase